MWNKKWHGYWKEFNSKGELIFEGEYLFGIKNGIGKEFLNNQLIFEGEYADGKKWNGKGIFFNDNDKSLYFEGEYLNGNIWNGIK